VGAEVEEAEVEVEEVEVEVEVAVQLLTPLARWEATAGPAAPLTR
jgi:hypothetical protein